MWCIKEASVVRYRLLAGTRTSSKLTCRVGWEFHPIFCSFAPNDKPGVSFSTTMEVIDWPVRHITT